MIARPTMLALLTTAVLTVAAAAQTPQTSKTPDNSGVGPNTTHPSQVDKGQNMILPSAGQAGQSAAPTMVYDCKNKPQDCTTPPSPGDKSSMPKQSSPTTK
ncbi:conserved exported hypothetical protein [Bosea sp. 62]|uniref:hypothetical protein n=1 Tax=unclassified Bosea (in: a-proteobacteria) TaxID=2653178 RepID=UPI001251DA74|nr:MULTISPECIES: hypothetical protein [unclassified Bosea (in: a-proteobacteria)]CAD5258051.1 conserved exported hypothetical protein [Bosea sp. 46]CAD5262476.1 conserved exported hypothetical protein [Bosea sp. 21B]CAD5277964.1 conserved exported hypothetical protein [Bosea sp. 7B]VVT58739.1 conserved exported hypothetical protein [Bosea sp. EC-HK365B]VXB59763.1 conserved exported hypothetical protein [Bosea sp. 29B]